MPTWMPKTDVDGLRDCAVNEKDPPRQRGVSREGEGRPGPCRGKITGKLYIIVFEYIPRFNWNDCGVSGCAFACAHAGCGRQHELDLALVGSRSLAAGNPGSCAARS